MKRQYQSPTPEQIEIIRWTASLGAITAEALALRTGRTPASARARLSAMRHRGLLTHCRPLPGRPVLYAASRAGLRSCDARGIRPCRLSSHGARHLMVCATAAAALERCYPDHRLIGERELRRDEHEHGHPLASAQLSARHGGENSRHSPDLVLWPSAQNDGLPVAVEVELTVKGPRRLADICRAWARCRVVAGVLYLVPAEVERALLRAVSEVCAWDKVMVVPLDSLPGMESDADPHVGSV